MVFTWCRKNGIPSKMDLQLLMWCKVIFIINLQCTLSKCLGSDITVAIYPQGDLNSYPGKPFEIFCTAENNYTSKDLLFRLGGKRIPSTIVNSTTIRLYVEHAEPQNSLYYCTNKMTNKHCLKKVVIDTPPMAVTDFQCASRNLDSLNCSWTIPPAHTTKIGYNLTFFANQIPVHNCVVQTMGNISWCVWNTTSKPSYRQQDEIYVFNLISWNVFGQTEQNFTIDHFSIVQPDPPFHLKVLSTGTHEAELYWEIPYNMVDLLVGGIDHKIEYQIEKQTSFYLVNTTGLKPKRANYTFLLTNLPYAHMQYEIKIYIKPKKAHDDKFWSEPAFLFFYTTSKVPDRPPDTAPGAFVRSEFDQHREIQVYWKQLEEYEENGANFTYRVMITQDGRTEVSFPERNKSLSYVVINRGSINSLQVRVQSVNEKGASVKSSYLYIPAERDILHGPVSFTKMAFENGTYELSWETANNNIDNYTLFWCQYNYTRICVGRMNFTTLKPSMNSYVIELPSQTKYQFAMAVNRGTQTSGMEWAICDISRDEVALSSFPVHIKFGVAGKTHIPLQWSMECTLRDGIITGYNITYCPTVNDTCDDTVGNSSVYIDNFKTTEINITNLLPFRTYKFQLGLNTTYGLKKTNATTFALTLEDVPSNPTNVTIYNVTNDSLIISWDPPLKRNGNIVRYLIYNYDQEINKYPVSNITDLSRRFMTLTSLDGFTNYSLSVIACNAYPDMSLCSKRNRADEILVRTRIGPPSKLAAPNYATNPDRLEWKRPTTPAGTVDLYQIKRIRDLELEDISNTTELFKKIVPCEGVKDKVIFQVRAVNFDSHPYYGVYAETSNVILPIRDKDDVLTMHAGEWSEPSTVACRAHSLTMIIIFIFLFVLVIGAVYGLHKCYIKYKKMEDLKPVLPIGLGFSEKEITKYAYGDWPGSNDTQKMSSSDEVLLLPSKTTTQNPTIKQELNGSNDHTDSTTLSQTSLEHPEQEASGSDEGSTSSLHLDEANKSADDKSDLENEELCETDTESQNNSPYLDNRVFKMKPVNGYVPPVSTMGYVQPYAGPEALAKSTALKTTNQPTTSTYVMAGLSSAPIFTTGVAVPNPAQVPLSGYVRHDIDYGLSKHKPMNFPSLGPSPTKTAGPESLPSMHNLPSPKCGPDSSYIQLQSLEPTLTSLKPAVRTSVPLKQPASSGYISPADVVFNKHLNILNRDHGDDSAVLDPAMSPDVYCRFSWSTDPSNNNLEAILAESTSENSPKY